MVRCFTWLAVALSVCLASTGIGLAQDTSVRVTAPRANIRAAATTTSPVLGQVTAGTVLSLKAVDGDWFLVEVVMGGLRIEGWLSSTVATRVSTPAGGAASAALSGASVAVQAAGDASPLSAQSAAVRVIDADANSLRGLLSVFPADETSAAATGDQPATFVWTLPGRAADRVIAERRPLLLVSYGQVEGVPQADITPVLVRLAPALSGVRLVAAVRAPANQAERTDTDWDLGRVLRQDVVRIATEVLQPGVVRIRPTSNLDAGEYAVVLRLRRPVSGASALSSDTTGQILSTVWAFSIR